MIAGNMREHWPEIQKVLITFVGVTVACFVGIQLFAPSPVASLTGATELAPGVVAHVSFTGAPTGLAVGIAIGLGAIVLLLWRLALLIGRPRSPLRGLRQLPRAEAGQAITEFIIVFWALMMASMGVAQMGLMYNAKGVTLYAAYAAARSAIVWIPQDVPGEDAAHTLTMSTGSEKYGNIKNSAAIAVVPISRRASNVLAGLPVIGPVVNDVMNAIHGLLAVIPGASAALDYADRYAYAYALTNVYFVQQSPGGATTTIGSPGDTVTFPEHSDITVMVSHCFHLNIPVAAQIIDYYDTLPSEFGVMEAAPGNYTNINTTCTLTLETP
jgi:hypothetical protein